MVVKRILPHLAEDPEFVQMFLNEAKIAARFNHPNIAQIYDLGEGDGTYFIAMEYIHGEDLGRVMRKAWSTGQWIARPLAIRIVAAACEGLYYAHTARTTSGPAAEGRPPRHLAAEHPDQLRRLGEAGGLRHRQGGGPGVDDRSPARSRASSRTWRPSRPAGKALDHRADIFALGLVLYELLTGVRPLKRDSELATLQAALECTIDAALARSRRCPPSWTPW